MYATEAFGPFFSTVKAGPLPVEVLHHAKRALIDWHAALFPGLDAEAVQRLRGALEEEFGRGNATLPGGNMSRRALRRCSMAPPLTLPKSTTAFATRCITPVLRPLPPRSLPRRT